MIRIIGPIFNICHIRTGILCYINTSGVYCYFLENMINRPIILVLYISYISFLLSMILCIPYIDLVPIIFWELETTVYRALELERATIKASRHAQHASYML